MQCKKIPVSYVQKVSTSLILELYSRKLPPRYAAYCHFGARAFTHRAHTLPTNYLGSSKLIVSGVEVYSGIILKLKDCIPVHTFSGLDNRVSVQPAKDQYTYLTQIRYPRSPKFAKGLQF